MRFQIIVNVDFGVEYRSVLTNDGSDAFVSFPAKVGNPNFDSFLESQALTDAEVQAMEPDVWHDMAST